jgi:hypothetical protein
MPQAPTNQPEKKLAQLEVQREAAKKQERY